MVDLVSTGKGSMFDAQESSRGAASTVRFIMPDGRTGVKGIPLFDLPDIARGEPDRSEDYRAFVRQRTEWVARVMAAGGRTFEARMALQQAGHMVTDQTLNKHQEIYENEMRIERRRARVSSDAMTPVVMDETEEETADPGESLPNASPESLATVELMVADIRATAEARITTEIEELRARAEKYRKLRALRALLPE